MLDKDLMFRVGVDLGMSDTELNKLASGMANISAQTKFTASTIEGLRNRLNSLTNSFVNTKRGTAEFDLLARRIMVTQHALGQLDRSSRSAGQGMGYASAVGMNFNRVIQDAPYFMSSFNMGIMSIGNNIGPLAESLANARKTGESFGSVMKGMFTGMGGWLMVINLVVSGITALALATRETKDKTKDMAFTLEDLTNQFNEYEKSINKVKNELRELSKVELDETFAKISLNLSKSRVEAVQAMKEYFKLGILANFAGTGDVEKSLGDIKKLQDALNATMEQMYNEPALNKYGQLNKQLQSLQKNLKFSQTFDTDIKKIKELQTEIDKMTGKEGSAKAPKKSEIQKLMEQTLEYKIKELEANVKIAQSDSQRISMMQELVKLQREQADLWGRMGISGLKNIGDVNVKLRPNIPKELDKVTKPAQVKINSVTKEAFDFATLTSESFVNTFEGSMRTAWENIFGEANSFFEQFMQNVMSGLANLAAQKLGQSIFSAILGLFTGGVGGAVAGVGAALVGGNRPVNINIGNEDLGKYMVDNYNNVVRKSHKARVL